jgi:Tfp pilus assembly protein PilN
MMMKMMMMMMMMMRCLMMIPTTAVVAFVISSSSSSRRSQTGTMLTASNTLAATEAVQAAMEASAKYGPASPEAKVAWDTVEEISAGNRYVDYIDETHDAGLLLSVLHATVVESYSNHLPVIENFGSFLIQK